MTVRFVFGLVLLPCVLFCFVSYFYFSCRFGLFCFVCFVPSSHHIIKVVRFLFVFRFHFPANIVINHSFVRSVFRTPTGKLRAFPRHEAAAGGGRTEPGERRDAPGHVRAQHAHAAQGETTLIKGGMLLPHHLSLF